MLKRMGLLLLALALVCLWTSALAAPDDVLLFTRNETVTRPPSVETAVPVGDALYILLREYDAGTSVWTYQIYRFVQGQDTEPEKVCANICYTRSYPTLESARAGLPEDVNPEDGFGYLFGDGKNLYGFNTLTGSMAKLTFDGGVMQRQEVCTVDIEALMIRESDYAYMMDMVSPVIMDGELYFIFTDWRQSEPVQNLVSISLADGSVHLHPLETRIDQMTAYQDGMLLAYKPESWDESAGQSTPPALFTIRTDDGTQTYLQEYQEEVLYQMAYDQATDTLYYATPSVLRAMPAMGQPQNVAYTNIGHANGMALTGKGYAVLWGTEGLEIRNLDPAYLPEKTLTVVNTGRDAAALQFNRENPDVPLIYPLQFYTMETLAQTMVSGETVIDLAFAQVDEGFDAMMEKGYCADLSSSQVLMDFANSLYPAVQQEIMRDGKLYAIPVGISGGILCYKGDKLEEVGLTQADMPTNLVDLCAFITRWNNEWVDDENKANVLPICTLSSNREIVFGMMLNGYIDYYDATGQTLDFDTPLFEELLAALDSMDASNLDRPPVMSDMAYDEFYQLYTGLFVEDSLVSTANADTGYLLGPLALNGEMDYRIGAYMQVMFVNPRCENLPEAIKLLECYVQNLDAYDLIPLSPEANDPLPNPNYEQNVQRYQENLEELQAQLADVSPAEKRELEDSIAYYEQLLANQEKMRWNISPETIARYRELIGDHVYIRHRNVLYSAGSDTDAQLQALHRRYVKEQIPREQYIRELSQKARMIILENQ